MIDLIVQAGTRFALRQWLAARGLGINAQDTDPESPTFGEYFYSHTDPASGFIWWRHPSGKLEATRTVDNTDPENPVVTVTYFNGFYGMLRYTSVADLEAGVAAWIRNNTAISVIEGFNGVGGEGITIVTPEDLNAHLQSIGVPGHEWLGGVEWSDATLWYASPVMTGDQRDVDGVTYESLIDFNVWSPLSQPSLWTEIGPSEPGTQEWQVGVSYSVGDRVLYQGAEYECLQAHTSQTGWEPVAVPALWSAV